MRSASPRVISAWSVNFSKTTEAAPGALRFDLERAAEVLWSLCVQKHDAGSYDQGFTGARDNKTSRHQFESDSAAEEFTRRPGSGSFYAILGSGRLSESEVSRSLFSTSDTLSISRRGSTHSE